MSSGFWRASADLLIECDCGYQGMVPAIEDYERFSLTWDCPDCGHHDEGDIERD
ncbi:putative RNA-binding Zn-ribbon protein involved in translation (DUF1610 family) [Agromyces sp. 3263]|nr:putative RNA-binding Zn-ribbon protein involved in translation (DUF1610 family) [Agromyces sp. 3263]